MIFFESVGSRASLCKQIEAQRFALGFFCVQGRREHRSCKALHGKSPKGRRPLSFNLFSAAPPRRRRGMWRTQCGKSRNGGHHKRGLREDAITRDLAESNKSMDEGNHERLSGGSGKHLRGCHNPTARTK